MGFFLSLIINMLALMLGAAIMKNVHIRSWGTAFLVALLIGILNPTIGWVFNVVLNVATIGIFWLLGLGFIIRLLVTAIIIKIVDALLSGFKVKNFGTAFLLAIFVALVATLADWLI